MARPCRSPRSIRHSCSATPAPSTGAWRGKTSSSPNGSTTAAEPSEMIADVAFDAPVTHPFSYRVPEGWPLAPGQRVLAPLRGAKRVGMVVALREGDDARLKLLHRVADPAPILSPTRLDFIRWIAEESLSSLGSTSAALLPPPLTDSQGGGLAGDTRTAPPPSPPPSRPAQRPALLIGAGRERRVPDHIEVAKGGALVIAADVDAAARWAQRLAKLDRGVRLDSGGDEAARAQAWRQPAARPAPPAARPRPAPPAPVAPPGPPLLLRAD